MNRNSVRSTPTPSAPQSTASAASATPLMLATTRMRRPSRVAAGLMPLRLRRAAAGQPFPAPFFELAYLGGSGRNPNRPRVLHPAPPRCHRGARRFPDPVPPPPESPWRAPGSRCARGRCPFRGIGPDTAPDRAPGLPRASDRARPESMARAEPGREPPQAGESAQDSRGDIRHVRRARPQIGIVKRGEAIAQPTGFRLPGEFGVDPARREWRARRRRSVTGLRERATARRRCRPRPRRRESGTIRRARAFPPCTARDGAEQTLPLRLRAPRPPAAVATAMEGRKLYERADGDTRGCRDAAELGPATARAGAGAPGAALGVSSLSPQPDAMKAASPTSAWRASVPRARMRNWWPWRAPRPRTPLMLAASAGPTWRVRFSNRQLRAIAARQPDKLRRRSRVQPQAIGHRDQNLFRPASVG